MQIFDNFVNFVANLGTGRDKASHGMYAPPCESVAQLENAYRGSWLPRKAVDIPANDATREWRSWQADADQIGKIEAEEKRLGLKAKVNQALKRARLYGGSAIYIGIAGENPAQPLRPAAGKRIGFLTVMSCNDITAGPLEDDPFSSGYGMPKYYESNGRRIDPSRLCLFYGARRTNDRTYTGTSWADSVLLPMMESLKNVDSTMANIGSLIYEAKLDVIGIPGLNEMMRDDPKAPEVLAKRMGTAALLKGNNGSYVHDAAETYETKSYSFSNLDNIGYLQLQVASGAADIPATRFLGMSPGGLNASGESDYRNYIDKVTGIQENDIGTGIQLLDECIIYSALGSRPEEVYYEWKPLWQPSAKEKADIGKVVADTIAVLAGTQLIPEDALSRAAINMLTEHEIMPGLEQEVDDADTID